MATIVDEGMQIGKHLKDDGVKTSQIRKFLSAVNAISNKIQNKELDEDLKNEIQYLRVKLAYQAGREEFPRRIENISEFGLHYLQKILDIKIQEITDKSKWENFAKLMETIVAYHRFYGGKEK